jgi:hypothetical protein
VGEGHDGVDANADRAEPGAAGRGGWRTLEPVVRLVSATNVIGAISGAVVGGLGGRLVMRILFVTSDDTVRGVTATTASRSGGSRCPTRSGW